MTDINQSSGSTPNLNLNKATVATPSPRFAELEKKRELCRDLMGGTEAMQLKKTQWLPKHPAESDGSYKVRLAMNVLTNYLKRAVDKGAAKIFNQPIVLQENVPEDIQTICENIDRQGKALDPFMLDRAKQAFVDGISYILADSPQVSASTTASGEVSVEDAKKLNIRPYAVPINAQSLLECMTEMLDGVQTITRIRIMETVTEPDGDWGYKVSQQVRVLKREADGSVSFQIHIQNEKKEWVLKEQGTTKLKKIYLIPCYTNQCGFMEGEPPFQPAAELNLKHWRSNSEQTNALTFGRFAMLSASGIEEEEEVEVGPTKVLRSTNKDAKFAYVESQGKGIEQGWKDLDNIKKDIEDAAASLRVENQGRVTATAAALESEDSTSGLKAVAQGMQNSIEALFQAFAEILGIDGGKEEKAGGEVEVSTSFTAVKGTDVGWQELGKARADGTISKDAWLGEAQWRGELSPDFDFETNKQQRQDEAATLTPPSPGDAAAAKAAKDAKEAAAAKLADKGQE